jgi:gliding motility-associated-like protein
MDDLENGTNNISSISNYTANSTPATIYIKVDNGICFSITSFLLTTKNCPPTVYNFVSANNDSKNDVFFIDGLRNIFLNYKLAIYNRWGKLVWTGDNNTPEWDGYANKGLLLDHSEIPVGTYYYLLDLNDPGYPEPLIGYLYLTR